MSLNEESLKEMVKAGVHVGHRKSRRHPKMMGFIFGIRGNTEIIDVTKTAVALDEASAFLEEQVAAGKMIMFVCTRPSLAEMTKETAEKAGMPYVTVRWIGGMLTNFGVIGKRLEGLRELMRQEASGELAEKYTKAERIRFQRRIAKFKAELGGVENMTRIPDILVIPSLRANKLAAREAKLKGIPAVAIVDTDTDPSQVTHPIPANDDAMPSVALILGKLGEAIARGKAKNEQATKSKAQMPNEAESPNTQAEGK